MTSLPHATDPSSTGPTDGTAARRQFSSSARVEYLSQLQKLASDCRSLDAERAESSVDSEDSEDVPNQLAMLAQALDRLDEQMNEIRHAQHSATGVALALERRLAALEHSAPTAQSWRDLVQGIRSIREVVLSQAIQRRRTGDE